jgi:hypothetical protein
MVKCKFLDIMGYALWAKHLSIRAQEVPACWVGRLFLLISRRRYSDTNDSREVGNYPNRSETNPDRGHSFARPNLFASPLGKSLFP